MLGAIAAAAWALALAPASWGGRVAVGGAAAPVGLGGRAASGGAAARLQPLRSSRSAPRAPHAVCEEPGLPGTEFREQQHEWESAPNPHFEYNAAEDLWVLEGAAVVAQYTGELEPHFNGLRRRPFFRYYSVDLMASCSYLPQVESPCELDACEIEPTDGAPKAIQQRDLNEYEFELDSWSRWDMPSDFTEYYDLHALQETNTGYDGSRVWRFINQKICFQLNLEEARNSWKRDFNRGVSGIHSAISCSIMRSTLDEDGDTPKALAEFRRRITDEPGALNNLYFVTMLTLCAVERIKPRLTRCTFIGDMDECKPHIDGILGSPLLSHPALGQAAALLRENADSEQAAPWKMRLRTRDLMGVMNCVQCNLCRLHGKVMVHGLASALQVLLGHKGRGECDRDVDPFALSRIEVAALITAAGKLISACEVAQRLTELSKAQQAHDTATTANL